MSTGKTTSKSERLEARISSELKAILSRAASLRGRSLTDFVLASASEAAHRVIRESEILELSERDQLAFAEALVNPPAPSPALRDAVRRYQADPS
ncbi:MAG: DUF1778 domain-containing protein [Myxococcota bacterium]